MLRVNVPTVERLARVLIGLALAAYAWFVLPAPNQILVATGLCVALTGFVGLCLACALVGRRLKPKP